MEEENAFAKPNFPPLIMYVHTECIALHTCTLAPENSVPFLWSGKTFIFTYMERIIWRKMSHI
jgi:hypothetical protein